ncbi:MAG: hypothetical protein IJ731_09000 [Eubacterium sp.]|nr:hypothetical protein [Eubacterium sp.]
MIGPANNWGGVQPSGIDLNALFGRKVYVGTFTTPDTAQSITITHPDVGTTMAIYIMSTDPYMTTNFQIWGAVWFETTYCGINDSTHIGTQQYLTYANDVVDRAKQNNYRIGQVTNTSFSIPLSTSANYKLKPETKYVYIVVGDSIESEEGL